MGSEGWTPVLQQDASGRRVAPIAAVGEAAMLSQRDNRRTVEHGCFGRRTTLEQRAGCRRAFAYTANSAREAMGLMCRYGGSRSLNLAPRPVPALAPTFASIGIEAFPPQRR